MSDHFSLLKQGFSGLVGDLKDKVSTTGQAVYDSATKTASELIEKVTTHTATVFLFKESKIYKLNLKSTEKIEFSVLLSNSVDKILESKKDELEEVTEDEFKSHDFTSLSSTTVILRG